MGSYQDMCQLVTMVVTKKVDQGGFHFCPLNTRPSQTKKGSLHTLTILEKSNQGIHHFLSFFIVYPVAILAWL